MGSLGISCMNICAGGLWSRAGLRKLAVEEAVAAALARAAAESAKDLDALALAVDEAFGELSLREQEAVRLSVVEGCRIPEVARLLAIDPQAARTRVSRALRTMAAGYGKGGDGGRGPEMAPLEKPLEYLLEPLQQAGRRALQLRGGGAGQGRRGCGGWRGRCCWVCVRSDHLSGRAGASRGEEGVPGQQRRERCVRGCQAVRAAGRCEYRPRPSRSPATPRSMAPRGDRGTTARFC